MRAAGLSLTTYEWTVPLRSHQQTVSLSRCWECQHIHGRWREAAHSWRFSENQSARLDKTTCIRVRLDHGWLSMCLAVSRMEWNLTWHPLLHPAEGPGRKCTQSQSDIPHLLGVGRWGGGPVLLISRSSWKLATNTTCAFSNLIYDKIEYDQLVSSSPPDTRVSGCQIRYLLTISISGALHSGVWRLDTSYFLVGISRSFFSTWCLLICLITWGLFSFWISLMSRTNFKAPRVSAFPFALAIFTSLAARCCVASSLATWVNCTLHVSSCLRGSSSWAHFQIHVWCSGPNILLEYESWEASHIVLNWTFRNVLNVPYADNVSISNA